MFFLNILFVFIKRIDYLCCRPLVSSEKLILSAYEITFKTPRVETLNAASRVKTKLKMENTGADVNAKILCKIIKIYV